MTRRSNCCSNTGGALVPPESARQGEHTLYMIEHRWLGLREIGITSTGGRAHGYRRIDYWRSRFWKLLDVIVYDTVASMEQAEALAKGRLDQLGARDTEKLNELHPMLGDGRTEMYDPDIFAGDLDTLFSEALGVRLKGTPSVLPLRIADPHRARARKAWATINANKMRHYCHTAAFDLNPPTNRAELTTG